MKGRVFMFFNDDKLRQDMMDYFGTAMMNGNPAAMMDLIRTERAQTQTLIDLADKNGFSLAIYEED